MYLKLQVRIRLRFPESYADTFSFGKDGELAGSTATIFTSGFCSFRYSPTPVKVPPVPTPATNASTFPSVHLPRSWDLWFFYALPGLLDGFTNCPGIKLFGISLESSSAFAVLRTFPLLLLSVQFCSVRFQDVSSTLIVSGMVRMMRYPSTAAIDASPIPVFPEVGSMITNPSFRIPFSSASSIIAFATRSLRFQPG